MTSREPEDVDLEEALLKDLRISRLMLLSALGWWRRPFLIGVVRLLTCGVTQATWA